MILELFILGLLYEQPSYGYLLKKSVDQLALFRKNVSWGTMYPLLTRLEKQELLLSSSQMEGKKKRIMYTITKKGKEKFIMLMSASPEEHKPLRETFRFKLIFFHYLSLQQRTEIVSEYINAMNKTKKKIQQFFSENSIDHDNHYTYEVIKRSVDEISAEIAWAKDLLKSEKIS